MAVVTEEVVAVKEEGVSEVGFRRQSKPPILRLMVVLWINDDMCA